MTKKTEISSILKNSKNLVDIFNFYVEKKPHQKIFFKKKNNSWIPNNYLEIKKKIEKIKNHLLNNGIKKGDRVFLLSSNRIEWVEFDLAIMSVGAITVPSFVTNNQHDNAFIINDCKPKFIVIENENIYKKNKSYLKNWQKKIITIETSNIFENYNNILSKTTTKTKNIVIEKDQVSSIIYTSGTTGNPKGVVLTHESIMHNLYGALEIMDEFDLDNERFISFLPLSHSYERMAGLYFPILICAQIYFCSSMDKLLNEIKEIKPTILSAVPRLYENIFKKIKLQITKSNFIISFFLKVIFDNLNSKKKHNPLENFLSEFFIKLILKKKINNLLGGKIKILISGGAALNPEIGFFFNKLNLNLLQGYGQTEASPLISCNRKNSNDPRSVGPPVRNVKVKISKEGEILVKGKNLMQGYWRKPVISKKTIINGWLHTGDLGEIDKKGRIIITGRKKDLIITSGGDNISGQRIENILMSFNEISQVVVYGDNRPYLVALIKISDGNNEKDLKRVLEIVNKNLNSIERIRKFLVLDQELSYENGLMTQTMKIKRKKVLDFYQEKINKLYNSL
ncbi:MAG: long-chain fatty acid--CoA ligase [Rickettsiales bacterium]|nr:long-chain fatty acid--CoA ligase [Rickettsiales bacterium]